MSDLLSMMVTTEVLTSCAADWGLGRVGLQPSVCSAGLKTGFAAHLHMRSSFEL